MFKTQSKLKQLKSFVLCFVLLTGFCAPMAKAQMSAQVASPNVAPPNGNPPNTPIINGPSSVSPGTATSVYTTTASTSGVSFVWSISTSSAGTISVTTSGTTSTATVTWISSYSGSVSIYCTASNSYGYSPQGSKAVTVTGTNPFVPGSISPTSQSINYNTSPPLAIASTPTGGSGTITYQWQSSLNLTTGYVNVTTGTGGTTNSYTPAPLTATTYFQEIATNGSNTATSPRATVTVYPQVVISSPSPASQSVQSGTAASSISCSSVTGGTGSGYSYQWQSSSDGLTGDFLNINSANNPTASAATLASATTATLNPGIVYGKTYYRLQVTNNSGINLSSSSIVTVPDCYQLNTNPGTANNYIISSTIKIPGITTSTDAQFAAMGVCEVNQTIQYMDGLGRPTQTVQVKASPSGNDIVQPIAYDQYGRETTKYLPYVTPGSNNGAYRSSAISEQLNYYNPTNSPSLTQQSNGIVNTSYPIAITNFEPSPLNRIVEQGAPGTDWQPIANSVMGHTHKIIYTTNNATPFATDSVNGNQVRVFGVTINSDNSRSLYASGTYAADSLYVTITKDENWHTGRAGTIEEYKDFQGQLILKRTYNYIGGQLQQLSTYYVYDNLGLLCYVLPPGSNPESMNMIQATYDNLCYQYWYDDHNRLFRKKLPSKGWEFMIYNTLDQVVFTQDANQRNKNPQIWTFMQYDPQGRVAITGLWSSGGYPGSAPDANISAPSVTLLNWLTGWQNGQTQLWITRNNTTATGYVALAPQGTQFYTINYYDDYAFPGKPAPFTVPAGSSVMLRGLPTGIKTAVMNTVYNTNPDMLTTMTLYDDLGRIIQIDKQHYLGGTLSQYNYDQINNTYDFVNELTGSTRLHYVTNSGNTAATLSASIVNTYVYDHEGRKLQTWEQINGGANVLLSNNVYNEIGQLWNKQLHSTNNGSSYLQTIVYTYNERGWLLSSTAPLFEESLQYNTGTSKQYNGNIAYANWGTASAPDSKSYAYSYDKLNRLLGSASTTTTNNESGIAYDPAGNITALTRTGYKSDILTYGYTDVNSNYTNQLQSVVNTAGGTTGLVAGTTKYTYDNNGNEASQTNTVNTAQNKSYVYNLLNLPQVITLPTGTITYTYDANGDKLRKVSVISGTTTTEDYISGIQHNTAGAIDFIQTEEGRALNSAGNYHYEYSLTDHLGNERLTFDTYSGTASTVQSDDYYPFGLEISNSVNSPKNEYLYNKKELQEEFGQYDYGARFYDPVVARWNAIDPHAENGRKWSPYNYADDNPLRNIDPDGMDVYGMSTDDVAKYSGAQPQYFGDEHKFKEAATTSNNNDGIAAAAQKVLMSALPPLPGGNNDNQVGHPAWDVNGDGFLELEEANIWYREGNHQPITVSASTINLSKVNPDIVKGMKVGTVFLIHLLKSNFNDDGVVFGTLNAVYLGGNKISFLPNMYDFDIGADVGHPWKTEMGRNIATWLGEQVATGFGLAGEGKPYMINFSGTATIGQGSSWPNYPWKQ